MRMHNFTRKQRAEIALRAGGCCEACGARLKVGEGDADHVLPVELGGESVIENGQWLCRICHKAKTAQDVGRIRKSDRQRDKHIGAYRRSAPPMAGSRKSPWKNTFSRGWIPRDGGAA